MEREKYVDESWKETAEKEKIILAGDEPQGENEAQSVKNQEEASQETENQQSTGQDEIAVNFMNYIASLGYQSMIFLGEMPNPVTDEIDKNLPQAKFLIDTMVMLREKTKGNLSKQEDDMLNSSIYELQLRYVEISSGTRSGASGGKSE